MFKKLKKLFLNLDFIKFILIGGINTLNTTVISYLLTLLLDNGNVTFILGYYFSLTIAYFLNTYFVFKQNVHFSKYIKFCISYIPNFLIQNIIVIIFYNILNLPKIIAYGGAAIIGIPITFILLKIFAFKKEKR